MITHPEGLDIPDIPTSQIALDAMLAIGELMRHGLIREQAPTVNGRRAAARESRRLSMSWMNSQSTSCWTKRSQR